MLKNIWLSFFLIISTFYSFADVSRAQIERELDQAEKDFQIARKMFNPWYGGPLLTGSGNVMPPGYVNINPVLQITDNYATFDSAGHPHTINDVIDVNPVLNLGLGLFNRVDSSVNIQSITHKQGSHTYTNFGDMSIGFSVAILKEIPSIPAFKVSVKETFPTGKYKNFNPDKASIQSTGTGAYTTTFGIGVSKLVWWWLIHPMQFRLSLNYALSTKVSVTNFNTYGGGNNTDGKVSPGNSFSGSFGYEFSVMQKFVLAIDVAYEHSAKTTFKGILGTQSDGTMATMGNSSTDVLSLAPAIEIVFTPNVALVMGLWFSVWGRNTSDFVAGIINFSYGF